MHFNRRLKEHRLKWKAPLNILPISFPSLSSRAPPIANCQMVCVCVCARTQYLFFFWPCSRQKFVKEIMLAFPLNKKKSISFEIIQNTSLF